MANNPKKYASDSTVSAIIANIKNLFVKKTDLETSLSGKADKTHNHDSSYAAKDHNHNGVYAVEGHNHDTKYDTKGAAAAVQENLDTVSDTLDDHTSNSDIHFTAAERTKLSNIQAGAQVNTITGVKGNSESTYRTGNVNITKANIGLGNVDNTSDANKPISTAQQLAFDEVNDAIDTHTENGDIHVTATNKSNWNAAHTHSTSAHARTDATKVEDSSTNGNIKINGTETNVYSHPTSGVTAGTYKSVTVNAQGHVTGGSNPTTLSGFGITDGALKSDVTNHNTATDAHGDIRELITGLTTRLNTLANSDDTTLDQMSEIVAYIKSNKALIDGITTNKVNVSDIINNLTTNVTNKPLSAAQGVAIKSLIDNLQTAVNSKVDSLSDLGITATATELNYMGGVTSNVQAQLDSKANSATLIGRAGEGNGAEIFNDYSSNTASGRQAHAEGYDTTASGMRAHAEGQGSTASAQATHAEGYNTQATATAAHSEGYYTEATGKYSHAEGYMSKAQEQYAHAEGYSNTASGEASHAEGYATWADGNYSHTEGRHTTASGEDSHAEGFYTHAASNQQHVQGKYNIIDRDANDVPLNTYAHIVGNGTSNTKRSNAHTIDWNGNAWFAGNIYVGGTSQNNGATMVSSISTLTTAEYTALEEAEATNANTLYMITDADDEEQYVSQDDFQVAIDELADTVSKKAVVQFITWEDGDTWEDYNSGEVTV